jgi:hypothetical protein
MQFDFHRVEIPDVVLLVPNALQESFPVVNQKRLTSSGPPVSEGEAEIRSTDAFDVGDVTTHYGRFQSPFESKDLVGFG